MYHSAGILDIGICPITLFIRANFKTPTFTQPLRHAQILILEIFNIFLWLKFSLSLTLSKIERFETGSLEGTFHHEFIITFCNYLFSVHVYACIANATVFQLLLTQKKQDIAKT